MGSVMRFIARMLMCIRIRLRCSSRVREAASVEVGAGGNPSFDICSGDDTQWKFCSCTYSTSKIARFAHRPSFLTSFQAYDDHILYLLAVPRKRFSVHIPMKHKPHRLTDTDRSPISSKHKEFSLSVKYRPPRRFLQNRMTHP